MYYHPNTRHALPTHLRAWCLVALLALSPAAALAQTGVSDDRVSLPEGPGSLEGVGENVDINPNMGSMSWNIPIEVPAGFPGVAPSLALSYSSSGGGGVVGMGWSMSTPSIERMTYRGLPDYDRDDDFAYMGGQQLVRIPDTEPPVYRLRYEGEFVRLTWLEAGEGREGYWLVEYPDGSKGTFGATMGGDLVSAARVGDAEGTFRYHLVEVVDVFGHVARYDYRKDGHVSLVQRIGWNYLDAVEPRDSVTFRYEDRVDETGEEFLSDAKPGFNELLSQRLASIGVFSGAERIRRYDLSYEPYDASGGFTRLREVERFGVGDARYPVAFTFRYSRALGGVCGEATCDRPFMVDMGTVGVDLGSGQGTLVDINGDGLPDMLHTPMGQNHRFFLNVPSTGDVSAFDTTPRDSAIGTSAFQLGTPYIHVMDVNGDGFADLLNAQTGSYLRNDGRGDWSSLEDVADTAELPDFDADFDLGEENQLRTIRFMDYDGDKRIDILRAGAAGTSMFRNTGTLGFVSEDAPDQLGVGFETDNLDLADMNGDGLLDVVQLFVGRLRYRLNLGRGRWADWTEVVNLPITQGNLEQVQLEDLNGDALADLVIVAGSTVQYAINRNGTRFFDIAELTSAAVDGAIPERTATTSVLFADMNGNGSTDVVWADSNGNVRFLELFPVRPNLLSQIENGLGMVTEVTYSTSVEQLARDGGLGAWEYALPHPMIVVEQVDVYDLLTDVHEINTYRYRDGYYDGVEKQFRGYQDVEVALMGDASQEEGLTRKRFDVGATDTYRNGLLLSEVVESGGRTLETRSSVFEDCDVAEVPDNTELPVRFICNTANEAVIQEGQGEDAWVVTRSEMTYDGYGNVVRSSEHGVVSMGGGACAPCDRDAAIFGRPCGPQCLGDEVFTETDHVTPGDDTNGRWIIHAPFRERSWGREGSPLRTEALTYYDGAAFEGMPLGQLDLGLVTRATERVRPDSDEVIQVRRHAYDAHGNAIETLDPLGEPGGTHRRSYVYDDEQLRVVQTNIHLESPQGEPYLLRQEVLYEELFDKPVENTAWMRIVDGQNRSARRSSFYSYDAFGRITSAVRPGGDTLESPTAVYTYDLGNPTTRVLVQKRSEVGGALDLEEVRCLDGRGRLVQVRTRLSEGRYQVTGFTRYNARSQPVETFHPYTGSSSACDEEPPAGLRSTRYRYDGAYRSLGSVAPDEGIYGSPSALRTVYEPLAVVMFDAEDNDPDSPHADTPLVRRHNGLGRLVSLERALTPDTSATTRVRYDALGRLRGYVDAEGHEKVQEHDLLGRVVRVLDPNTTDETTFQYDAASNTIATTDDRGVTVRSAYDGDNRLVERWDEADRDKTLIRHFYDVAPSCPAATCSHTEGRFAQVEYPLDGVAGEVGRDVAGYDVRGRTILTSRTIERVPFEMRMGYDNSDRLTSVTWPDGRTTVRRYDDASRLSAIDGIAPTISYNERNLANEIGYADGSGTSYAYDDILRLANMTTTGGNGDALQDFTYTYNRAGNVLSVTDGASPNHPAPDFDAAFTYDAWYRSTNAQLGAETVSMTFDWLDNITARTSSLGSQSPAHVGDYSYSFPNAVASAGSATFTYDPAGYLGSDGRLTYTWDWQGRLVRAEDDRGEVGRFLYGAGPERVIKVEGDAWTHYVNRNFELRDGISSVYVRVGSKRAARIESDALATALLSDVAPLNEADDQINAADAWVAWADAEGLLDANLVEPSDSGRLLMSAVRRLLVETGPADGVTFLHHDHLGSITLATVGGEAVGHRGFYPFGGLRESYGHVDPYGFSGQEQDASTGLLRFNWRYLNPRTGRWTSIDPAFATATAQNIDRLGESTTAYAYVANSPINGVDPDGLFLEKLLGKSSGKSKAPSKEAQGGSDAFSGMRKENMNKFKNLPRSDQKTVLKIVELSQKEKGIFNTLREQGGELVKTSPDAKSYDAAVNKLVEGAAPKLREIYLKQSSLASSLQSTGGTRVFGDTGGFARSATTYQGQAQNTDNTGFIRSLAAVPSYPRSAVSTSQPPVNSTTTAQQPALNQGPSTYLQDSIIYNTGNQPNTYNFSP